MIIFVYQSQQYDKEDPDKKVNGSLLGNIFSLFEDLPESIEMKPLKEVSIRKHLAKEVVETAINEVVNL